MDTFIQVPNMVYVTIYAVSPQPSLFPAFVNSDIAP